MVPRLNALVGPRNHVYRCTLAQLDQYHWTIYFRRWCGLLSNYFEHLLS